MRVLVTGGAGFIGSHLVDALVDQAHQVAVIDNLSVGKLGNIEHHVGDGGIKFVEGSVLDADALEPLVGESELIYHLAAVVGVRYVVDDPLNTLVTNIGGTENVLKLAFKHGVRTVIASSSEIYGKSAQVPLQEEGERLLGPTTAKRWCYSDTKAVDEYLAWAYAERGLPVSAVRYFNVYGPRLDPLGYGSVIARFLSQAMQGEPVTVYDDGEQTRCFTYVTDAVDGTLRAGTVDEAVGQAFNIGSSRETSINDLAALIIDVTASSSKIERVASCEVYGAGFEEARRRVPDVARARQVLGFEASVPLGDGLRRTAEWFRAAALAEAR